MARTIYAADDDANIRALLDTFLTNAGYETTLFDTGDKLLAAFRQEPCDLVLMDIMMPGTDGLEICRQLRAVSQVPIILLTARDTEADYVMGITLGGDDYMMKPFRPSLLVMKIKALFRRMEMEHEQAQEDVMTFGGITFTGSELQVAGACGQALLTMTEARLLRVLMEAGGKGLSREQLLDRVWGYTSQVETRVTDETVRRLRRKLAQAGSVTIATIWGYGYKLAQEGTP